MSSAVTTPLWQWCAADASAAIRRGDVSCEELMTSVLERIDATNTHLNALVAVDGDGALAQARAADAIVAGRGPLPPLHGVPITVKANVDVGGDATTHGVSAFADLIAPADSPAVRNLRGAGAIIVGRSNVPEFSLREIGRAHV